MKQAREVETLWPRRLVGITATSVGIRSAAVGYATETQA